ncbi:MAG: hypothetical protein HWD59_10910 [Coxiellaceae bacterium]|nr:MAG: hypothetical protein HWD59_10910 [Coxiellaceae bacterium]
MHIKILRGILAVLCLLLANIGLASMPGSHDISYLFIQTAKWSVLKPIDSKPGYYQLVLHGVEPYVPYFSDRPNRVAGIITTTQFIAEWNNPKGFQNEAPNVGMVGVKILSVDKKNSVNTLTLNHPVYDPKAATVTYQATIVGGEQTQMPTHALVFKPVALFIDNVGSCWSCVGPP